MRRRSDVGPVATGLPVKTNLPKKKNDMDAQLKAAFERFNLPSTIAGSGDGEAIVVHSPIDGSELATLKGSTTAEVETAIDNASAAFKEWRIIPAPIRGEFVRLIGDELRSAKADLAAIVSWEAGKITQESLGEVQEMIDICDFAVGLSRQLYGVTMGSERPGHRLTEQWHPLGPIGVISAFNFPVAVWAWNAMLALACGDPVIWKPSEKTPLCAAACQAIVDIAAEKFGGVPDGLTAVVQGKADVGKTLSASPALPLISATGSIPMGRDVAKTVAGRLGRSLLELGGNNATIVTPSADLDLALRGIVFSAVGTCGQRCTTLRRLIVHDSIADDVLSRMLKVYKKLPIGRPVDEGHIGRSINRCGCRQADDDRIGKRDGSGWNRARRRLRH